MGLIVKQARGSELMAEVESRIVAHARLKVI